MPIEKGGKEDNEYAGLTKLKARVVFKILAPPLRARTDQGMIERPQTSSSIPATYTRQLTNGTHENVRYYKTKTQILKGTNMVDQYNPEFVTIEGGELNLSTVTDKDLYYFLVNHPHNKSNPLYDLEGKNPNEIHTINEIVNNRTVPFEFYEVDRRKSSKANLTNERKLEAAKKLILAEEGDEDYIENKQIVLLCKAYSMHEVDDCVMVDDYDTLRNSLLEQAKVDPVAFMEKIDSAALGLEAMVADAVKLNVIKYDQPETKDGGWFWDKVNKPIKPVLIVTVSNAKYQEKEQILIDFLRHDAGGVTISKRMKDEVNTARKEKMTASVG